MSDAATTTSGPAIELEALTLDVSLGRRRTRRLLDHVDLRVASGEIVALAGPSGSGKSTLVRALLGLVAPSSGRVRLFGELASDGAAIHSPPEARGLAVVFQELALWPHMTVRANLEFGLRARGVAAVERGRRIDETLAAVDLSEHAERSPAALSGGERQRVALARALVLEPRALILDEPLAGVDVQLAGEIIALLGRVVAERALTTLLVTHSGRELAALARRVVVLEAGRVTQDADLDELRVAPATAFARALAKDSRCGAR